MDTIFRKNMLILQDFSSKYQSLLINWNTSFICNFLFEQRNRHLKRFWRPVWGLYTELLILPQYDLKNTRVTGSDIIAYIFVHLKTVDAGIQSLDIELNSWIWTLCWNISSTGAFIGALTRHVSVQLQSVGPRNSTELTQTKRYQSNCNSTQCRWRAY